MGNQAKIILICVFLNVTMVCLVLIVFCLFHMNKKDEYNEITNYSTYKRELVNNTDVHSKLVIFPDKIDEKNVIDFQYLKEDGLFDGAYLFYLAIDYDKDLFLKEANRIKELHTIYDDTVLSFPTYLTILDGYGTYEYVILDEEDDKIIYIFNQLLDWSKTKIEKDYILQEENINIKLIGYNTYIDNDS